MKKLLLILLCLPMIGFGQFTDDFSDGDFTNNPTWIGDNTRFEVDTNFSLHLNDTAASTSSLVTQSQAIINGEWIFSVSLDFSPSTNNFAKVYLASDMIDLSGSLNGMYVKIGGQSGNIDNGIDLDSLPPPPPPPNILPPSPPPNILPARED